MKLIQLLIGCGLLLGCTNTPENTALTQEAMRIALAEYQRQHPVRNEK